MQKRLLSKLFKNYEKSIITAFLFELSVGVIFGEAKQQIFTGPLS